MPFSAQMGKKKSKARSAPSSSTTVALVAISEADIIDAIVAGDLIQLQGFGRQGVRVTNADPLFVAMEGGNVDVVRCLVTDLGADVSQRAHHYNLDVIRCLVIEYGADVNRTSSDGWSPLYTAAEQAGLDVLKSVVHDFGADINLASQNGATPLYIAAKNGRLDVLRYLGNELGADVNQAKHDGATPLFIAAQKGLLDVVRYLVAESGADITRRGKMASRPYSSLPR
jgi:hypothetical protein